MANFSKRQIQRKKLSEKNAVRSIQVLFIENKNLFELNGSKLIIIFSFQLNLRGEMDEADKF